MAKKLKPRQTTGKRRSRSYASFGQEVLSSPITREVLAAVLVYAAATLIKGQARKGSTTRQFVRDLGSAGNIALGTLGQIGSFSIADAIETLRAHWQSEPAGESEDMTMGRRTKSRRKAASASRARRGGRGRSAENSSHPQGGAVSMN